MSIMSEKINTDHFSTMEDLLEHLKIWEKDDDIDAYYRFFSPNCAFELANKIENQQKEIEELKEMKPLQDLIDTNIIIADYSHNYISKDKIREKIKEIESFDKAMHQKNGQFTILVLQGLLKEDDGDHIPRID